jgi:hypothetical protein
MSVTRLKVDSGVLRTARGVLDNGGVQHDSGSGLIPYMSLVLCFSFFRG